MSNTTIFTAAALGGCLLTAAGALITRNGWLPQIIQPLSAPTSAVAQSEPLPDAASELRYLRTEEALAELHIRPDEDVALTSEMQTVLAAATAELPLDLSDSALARLRFLAQQQVGGRAGRQMASLIEEYYRYRQLEARSMVTSAPEDLAGERAALMRTIALREQFFGAERAAQLFADEHALALYTLDLRAIEQDTSLSMDERTARQQALEARYLARTARSASNE